MLANSTPYDFNSVTNQLIVSYVFDGFWIAFAALITPLLIFFVIHGLKKIAHN